MQPGERRQIIKDRNSMEIKVVENHEYFSNYFWDERTESGCGKICLRDGVYHIKNLTYPKYFRYEESFDTHFCGDWFEVSEKDYKDYISKCIAEKRAEICNLYRMLIL